MDELEKIDLIRERINVSYEKAREALKEVEGDLVDALVKLEKNLKDKRNTNEFAGDNLYKVKGQELIDKIKEIIKEGNVNKIAVKNDNKTLVEIPVTAGVISLVLFPYMGILAGMTAMYKDYTLEIKRKHESNLEKEDDYRRSQQESSQDL